MTFYSFSFFFFFFFFGWVNYRTWFLSTYFFTLFQPLWLKGMCVIFFNIISVGKSNPLYMWIEEDDNRIFCYLAWIFKESKVPPFVYSLPIRNKQLTQLNNKYGMCVEKFLVFVYFITLLSVKVLRFLKDIYQEQLFVHVSTLTAMHLAWPY
jgi:hypothetical protein